MYDLNPMMLKSLHEPASRNKGANPAGADGREVELQTDNEYVQWRYKGYPQWNNLVSIESLKGETGKTGQKGERGEKGETGAPGPQGQRADAGPRGLQGEKGTAGLDGLDGKPGANGREVELNKSDTHIQWRRAGSSTWIDIIPLSDLKGAKGDKGEKGDVGEQGRRGEKGQKGDRGTMGAVGYTGAPGPAGPQGAPGSGGGGAVGSFKVYQQPVESPNGVRTTFTVPDNYVAGTLLVILNGLIEVFISELTANTFSFDTPPIGSDTILLNYAVL